MAVLSLVIGVSSAAPAAASFNIVDFSGGAFDKDGATYSQAGGHPYVATTRVEFPALDFFKPDEGVRDTVVELPAGWVGNPRAVPAVCAPRELFREGNDDIRCPIDSQVGVAEILGAAGLGISVGNLFFPNTGIFRMEVPEGSPAMFAFKAGPGIPVYLVPSIRSNGDYGLTVRTPEISQAGGVTGAKVTLWGVPGDSSHDSDRGTLNGSGNFQQQCAATSDPECSNPAGYSPTAFVTNPTNCEAGPLTWRLQARSWEHPETWFEASFDHDTNGNSTALSGCDVVPFEPTIGASLTTDQSETPSGLDFSLNIPSTGLLNPDGIAQSHLKRAVVTLPEGVTVNPSAAEGLGVCTPADYARETAGSAPGAGCPNSSRLGSVRIDTPLLEEPVEGSLYIAQQDDPRTATPGAENPFDSLLAMYVIAKIPNAGVIVKAAGKVSPDPVTGQLTTTFDDLPQLPFERFSLHFREGQRSPLVSPPSCGPYEVEAQLTPYSDPGNPVPVSSQFQVTRGVGGGSCASSTSGDRAFHPGLLAGSLNNTAGAFSPFNVRLTRQDGEQEFSNFSLKLPPGVSGKLAGIPFCPDAAIAAAKGKTGAEELASPSCPQASEVGETLVGAGVGSVLTYVPGKVYLAGPFNGSALSVAAITSAKVGPFDLGTVVIREALKINPETAEVFIDATGSDPIPHIIEGIPVHARDIRVHVNRPDFVLNPTSCERTSVASTVLGSGLDFGSSADDQPYTATSPFQVASCASLGFKPKLVLRLIGGTERGDNPKFKAVLTARPGDANIARAQVRLPHSAFLEQAHIKTICTRVQFAQGSFPGAKCPAGSIYGHAKALTPLLDEPLQGPVFLRSSNHPLPDLVAALHSGKIDINVVGRLDAVNGGIRNTFEAVPDAPVSKFILTMRGGKQGLIANSVDLCRATNRARAAFDGQNGKIRDFKPALKPTGCKRTKKRR